VDDESPLINDNSSGLSHTPRKYIYPKEPFFGKIAWMIFGGAIVTILIELTISSSIFILCTLDCICILLVTSNSYPHGQGYFQVEKK
jgi:hypothetical protein